MFVVGPGVYHEIISDNQEAMGQHCICFDIDYNLSSEKKVKEFLTPECREINAFFKKLSFWIGVDFNFGRIFEELHKEFLSPVIGSYAFVNSVLTGLIIEFIRCSMDYKPAQYKIPRKTSDEVRKIIIDEAFNKNYLELTKKQLAAELHISIRQLERILSQYYFMSFREKLTQTRIEHAKVLLTTTEYSMDEISQKTGFSSTGSFSSSFKEFMNMTPSKYRQKTEL
jgi:AraC-like DNA-binding protein